MDITVLIACVLLEYIMNTTDLHDLVITEHPQVILWSPGGIGHNISVTNCLKADTYTPASLK